jgi:hypothetical protein
LYVVCNFTCVRNAGSHGEQIVCVILCVFVDDGRGGAPAPPPRNMAGELIRAVYSREGSHISRSLWRLGGVFKDHGPEPRPPISVVGYSTDAADGDYWVVCNSWGTYWGDS